MYKWFLPLRFFLKRRITYLAVIAVMLCVFTVVVVMTVMNGLVVDFVKKTHDFVGDCVVSTDSLVGFGRYEDFITELDNTDFVYAAEPVIKTFGLVKSKTTSKNAALSIMGIDPKAYTKVTNFASTLHYRKAEPSKAFVPQYDPNLPGCLIGIDLLLKRQHNGKYTQMNTLPRWSYSITCFPLTAKGALLKTGTALSASSKTFYYSDNVKTGLAKVDSAMIYLPFSQLQALCGMAAEPKRTSAILIKFKKGTNVHKCTEKVTLMWNDFVKRNSGKRQTELFKTVTVQDWKSYKRDSIAPMEKEQTMMIMLFIMVGVITVFIIFVIFYMLIAQKSKDIGILKSIGASGSSIVTVFLRFAFLIGFSGTAGGLVFGLLFLAKINTLEGWLFEKFGWQLWNREVYSIGDIPNRPDFILLTVVFVCAVAVCIVGALLPTIKGASKKCVDILRVNEL